MGITSKFLDLLAGSFSSKRKAIYPTWREAHFDDIPRCGVRLLAPEGQIRSHIHRNMRCSATKATRSQPVRLGSSVILFRTRL